MRLHNCQWCGSTPSDLIWELPLVELWVCERCLGSLREMGIAFVYEGRKHA